ncbi:MAG TPA: 3-hydroxybutyrate oligomer hydrolase family protein [Usitatibacter sp.]|jgi:hydroxybutyrate-dimer hydrolase|nr:3-hydroxybutyrate oligomer hydrolase family protein [Usitatibacter sp.]
MSRHPRALLAALPFAIAACSHDPNFGDENVRPDYIKGAIVSATYDGTSNDLLTAGLGKSGLAGAAPAVATPAAPTVAELRTLAIYNNYRALVDMTAAGGYGVLYGPNIDVNGNSSLGEGKVAGEEHIAYADDGTGAQNVTMMVQIPASFSPESPCIVSAVSSGSRGVYGAIATAGEWGLKHGCAVAYSDKGTGNGGHDLAANTVDNMQGTRMSAAAAGKDSEFTANLSSTDLAAFNAAFPNRWAYKQAHSQQNPEATWGRDNLRAIEFAFYMLNQKYGETHGGTIYKSDKLALDKTIVIASSVSNGAGAALAAAEQDTQGLIDGVAVGEPQVQVNLPASVVVKRGGNAVTGGGKSLYEYFAIANLYEPCAALADASATAVGLTPILLVNKAAAANRCAALAANGLVTGATPQEQANAALAKMLGSGWEAESIAFMPTHYLFAVLPVEVTYANAYAKASVKDNLCGYSFGGTPAGGVPAAIPAAAAAQLFGTGNGVPPTGGINILNNNSVGGVAVDAASVSPSTGKADYNYDGAKCLYDLFTAQNATGTALRAGIDASKRSANLRGKPVILVQGRSDTLVPVNHASRAYYALNKSVESGSKLVYYEVTNAQHFDSFVGTAAFAGYDTRLIPLHRYFLQAMDIMYANLKNGAAIPASQVVRTTPRGGTPGAAPAITPSNVPPIAATPAAADAITFSGSTLSIPD